MTRPPFAAGSTLTVQDVADLIDHALLKPELTPDEVAAAKTPILKWTPAAGRPAPAAPGDGPTPEAVTPARPTA